MAEGSEELAAVSPVDVSSASTRSVTCVVDVAVSVCFCWLPVAISIDATRRETSAFPASVAGATSIDPPVARVIGAESLSAGSLVSAQEAAALAEL